MRPPLLFAVVFQIFAIVLLAFQHGIEPLAKVAGICFLVCSLLICYLQVRKQIARSNSLADLHGNASRLANGETLKEISGDKEVVAINEELSKARSSIAEALRKENAVVNYANDVICSIGMDHSFLSVNPACRKVWGYEPEEVIGKKLRDLIIDEDQQSSIDSLIGAQKSLDTLNFESRLRKKNGEIINILWSAHWSIADKALFCVSHDITERKKAERILAESEARFREVFNSMPIGLLITNKKNFIELTNPAVTELYGYTASDLIGKSVFELFASESALSVKFEANTEPLRDVTLKSKTGQIYNCQLSVSELNMREGPRLLLVLIDITEQKRVEQLKQAFFMMISHDLRSPLTSLMYVFERLKSGKLGTLNEGGLDLVARNSDEAKRLVDLVSELLDIEKIRSGELPLSLAKCNIKEVIQSAINSVRGIAVSKEIEIDYAAHDLRVNADRSLLTRVVVNLLSNAVKFSPDKSAVQVELIQNESSYSISVKDKGKGIPAELADYIFEPFKQVSADDHSRLGGSGLGLAICKLIVEHHNGVIQVTSAADTGSTFTVTIPINPQQLG